MKHPTLASRAVDAIGGVGEMRSQHKAAACPKLIQRKAILAVALCLLAQNRKRGKHYSRKTTEALR